MLSRITPAGDDEDGLSWSQEQSTGGGSPVRTYLSILDTMPIIERLQITLGSSTGEEAQWNFEYGRP